MNNISKTLYYRVDVTKPTTTSRNINTPLKNGDSITFYGDLYEDVNHTRDDATTVITYTVSKISPIGVLMNLLGECTLVDGTGSFVFKGNILAQNFNVIKNVVQPEYIAKAAILSIESGTGRYEHVFGNLMYEITGPGIGIFRVDKNFLSETLDKETPNNEIRKNFTDKYFAAVKSKNT